MSARQLILFFTLLFAVSWSIQLTILHLFGAFDAEAALPFSIATMFMPTLVAVGFLVFAPSTRSGVLWKPTWAMWPLIVVGALTPALITFGMVGIVVSLGWADSGWFAFSATGVQISGGPWLLGEGAQGWPMFAANVAATAVVYAAMASLLTVGEEFGWRAFLQGKLIERFGVTGGIALLGFCWAMWHLPAQLLGGYNYPDYPVLGALVMSPIMLIGISFFLGWLTLAARSFWPAAIAHGAYNSLYAGVNWNLEPSAPRLWIDLVTTALVLAVGLISWAALRAMRERAQATTVGSAARAVAGGTPR